MSKLRNPNIQVGAVNIQDDLEMADFLDAEMKRIDAKKKTVDTKHTKGPWKIVEDKGILEIANESEDVTVCKLYNDENGHSDDLPEADAALIAAAPEMLEQLERAIDHFGQNGGESAYTWLHEMKLVVARAKGKI